jgi:hypothetical protein
MNGDKFYLNRNNGIARFVTEGQGLRDKLSL